MIGFDIEYKARYYQHGKVYSESFYNKKCCRESSPYYIDYAYVQQS